MEQEIYIVEVTRMATEYYVAGRMAAVSGMLTICGNLFHHAFELIIKAALMKWIDVNSVRPLYQHNIPRLWTDLKQHYSVTDLQFDTSAEVIHKFEDLRYPDKYINDQNQISVVGLGVSGTAVRFGSSPGVHISVNLDQLNEWWLFIHKLSGFNPECYLQAFQPPAREFCP